MGADSFFEIPTWKEARKVFYLTNLVVTTRPGFLINDVDRVFNSPVFKGINFAEDGEDAESSSRSIKISGSRHKIYFMKTAPVPISSTKIREQACKGKDISSYLPKKVERYIIENGIYND